jgi:predicted transcriptional regulator
MTRVQQYRKPLKHLVIIADEIGMTHEGVRQALKSATSKVRMVYDAVQEDEYEKLRTKAASMVVASTEHALEHNDFLAQLTNRLTFWMLQERRKSRGTR